VWIKTLASGRKVWQYETGFLLETTGKGKRLTRGNFIASEAGRTGQNKRVERKCEESIPRRSLKQDSPSREDGWRPPLRAKKRKNIGRERIPTYSPGGRGGGWKSGSINWPERD